MRRVAWLLAVAASAVVSPAASHAAPPLAAPAATARSTPYVIGRPYPYRNRRDDVLGTWLPRGEEIFEPWRRHRAAVGPLGYAEMFTVPKDSTFFWYGEAGPPKVELVYDPVHRVALYYEGCCAWQETVLASAVRPPPHAVKSADLSAVRTPRGIGLGVLPSAVRRAYGPARMYASTTTTGLNVLAYYRTQHTQGSDCGWYENFVFRANRLVLIQSGHGC